MRVASGVDAIRASWKAKRVMMIRLRTLASIELHSTEGEPLGAVIAQPKRLALLAYLALARPFGFHRRDRLFAMFWPEQDESRARDSLNQAIRFLRQSLGSSVVVSRGAEEVGLDRAQLWCDALEFQAALDQEKPREAIELYRGELLSGFFVANSHGFEEWLEAERARLREQASFAARSVAEAEEAAGRLTQALRWGRLAANLSNDDERALRRWLMMLARAGDRAGAIQAYDDFARRLRDEYEADPSPETQDLVETIRREVRRPLADGPSPIASPIAERQEPVGAEPSPFSPGGVLAHGWYVITHEIGAGGMATVYMAHDVRHNRRVVVKVLRAEIALAVGIEGFLREIRIAAALQHPHIVPVFDSGAVDGRLYFVMPLIEGESLRARLDREGALPLGDALRIAREVADALAYAHKQGIVHRDIKPENVLLTGEPGAAGSHALVADFGIARAIETSGAEKRLTQTGVVVGSPAYMSPEQAAGDTVDGRSDVYSLGCVLYEMLAGEPPFVGKTRFSVLALHSQAPVPMLTKTRVDITQPVQEVVARALAKAPSDRYDTAAAFERAIHTTLANVPNVPNVLFAPTARRSFDPNPTRRPRRFSLLFDAAIVLTILSVATWKGLRTRHVAPLGAIPTVQNPVSADFDKRSIAVLRLDDLTPGHQFEYIAAGLTNALISQMQAAPELLVASPNVSTMFRERDRVRVDSAARQLGVGTLLTGSITSLGSGVRVDLTILDALSGQLVTTARIDQADRDWVRLQASLAAAVTKLLRRRLGDSIHDLESHPGTRNSRAWEAMQRATSELGTVDSLIRVAAGPMTLAHITRADSMLDIAAALDGGWNEPLIEQASLGDRAMRSGFVLDDLTANWWLRVSLERVESVLERSPGDRHAIRVRGTLRFWKGIRGSRPLLGSAERDLRVAVGRDPRDAAGWNALSNVLLGQAEGSEATTALENALRIDPFLPELAWTFTIRMRRAIFLGFAPELTRWCKEGNHRFPDNYNFVECQLWLRGLPGAKPDTADLWAIRDEYVRKSPAYVAQFSKLKGNIIVGLAFVRAGQREKGKALADGARGDTLVDPRRELTWLAAIVYAQAGDTITSVNWVAQALEARPSMREDVACRCGWEFAPLFSVERFRKLGGPIEMKR